MRVLIVDDSGVMRKIVAKGLRQAGFKVDETFEAGDGVEGLSVLADNSVDLIVADWNMPNMDGLTFVQELRKTVQTPVVMITTEGGEAKVAQAMAMGANGHIKKPFTPEKLQEVIGPLV